VTGSIANIIVIEKARPTVEISFKDYLRVGVPVTIATMVMGIVWLTFVG
jgi:Na+/H+ antiporter NhaD/arsenite permease-like protein